MGNVLPAGFKRHSWSELRSLISLRKGQPYDRSMRDRDIKTLFAKGWFRDVRIEPRQDPDGSWTFTVTVEELQSVLDVQFTGLAAVAPATLKKLLRINPGDYLNPYLIKVDRDAIRDHFLSQGYHFSAVRDEIVETPSGLNLVWHIHEGPQVRVRAVEFSGNKGIEASTLKQYLLTKEPSKFLIFPTAGEFFIRRYLEEDLKRIKLYYQLEGYLDITDGDRVFVEDLVFSDDRTEVTVKIHIDEGRRYRIRRVGLQGVSGKVVTEEEIRAAVKSGTKGHEDFSDTLATRDAQRIRDLYGERAYILAQVDFETIIAYDKAELDLTFRVQEGPEIRVGRITVQGNHKTRFDVVLRELKDFAPGEKFNNQLLQRGINRLRDRQYFEPAGGIVWRTEPTDDPAMRDLVLEVKEGSTGQIRFAGGYSSSFGILGIIEFSQKNFDIADLPKSLSDFGEGTAFAGGGQQFNVRYSPSRERQSFVINFVEPYVFGHEFGLNLRGYNIRTQRESWEEERIGASVGVGKRWENIRLDWQLNVFRLNIRNTEIDAPFTVVSLAGDNLLVSTGPGVTWDTRDSALFPSQGHRIGLTYEWAGGPLPGDFDFGKTTFNFDIYRTIYETEAKMKHILNLTLTVGHAKARNDSSVPFFERFYAGGRDSIRGFEFRGMGPKEQGDPVGGNGYGFVSLEYSYPLFVDFLRGALFYDVASLAPEFDDLRHEKWRNTIGFGIRFIIPQLGNIPVALDFGFPLTKRDDDERETVLFDIGKLF